MDYFLVCRANGGEHASKVSPSGLRLAADKIVRAQPDPALHWHECAGVKIEPLRMYERWLMVALQDERGLVEVVDCLFNRCRPFRMRQIAAEVNAAGAPGVSRKAGHLQDE